MRNLMPLLALPLLSGCLSSYFEGIWLVQQQTLDFDDCPITIDENFVEAQAPDDDDTVIGLDFQLDLVLSPAVFFIQIIEGRNKEVVVVVDDIAYPGLRDGDTITAMWDASTVLTETQSHNAGYSYQADESTNTITTMNLSKDTESKGISGDALVEKLTNSSWTESDRWDFDIVGIPGGQIPAFNYLEGARITNEAGLDDCQSDPCTLAVQETCTAAATLTASWVGYATEAAFASVEDAGQLGGNWLEDDGEEL